MLRETPDPELIERVAGEMHKLIAATGKFIGFCTHFAPDPPAARPQLGQFDFESGNYKAAIEKIYRYRSRALHGGTPFPKPMCDPPRSYEETGIVEERPTGLAANTLGATWLAEDLPMYLHLFAHVTQGALLNWWHSMGCPDEKP